MPPLPTWQLIMQAAHDWGVPWDEWQRKPFERRAEMAAFYVIERERQRYCEDVIQRRHERDKGQSQKAPGFNPMAAQRSAFGLPEPKQWVVGKS